MISIRVLVLVGLFRLCGGTGGVSLQEPDAIPQTPIKVREERAKGSGEPGLQTILDKLGYSINTEKEEIRGELFVPADPAKPVTHRPLAAYGLLKVCTSGWYRPTADRPDKIVLWKVDEPKTEFQPGDKPFGLWVATAGFPDETICTEDALHRFVPRFKPNDRHKAHVFAVRREGKLVPNAYIIGWEYSTNNDDQDIVTLVENVRIVSAPKP
jgi:hypothetical protein